MTTVRSTYFPVPDRLHGEAYVGLVLVDDDLVARTPRRYQTPQEATERAAELAHIATLPASLGEEWLIREQERRLTSVRRGAERYGIEDEKVQRMLEGAIRLTQQWRQALEQCRARVGT